MLGWLFSRSYTDDEKHYARMVLLLGGNHLGAHQTIMAARAAGVPILDYPRHVAKLTEQALG